MSDEIEQLRASLAKAEAQVAEVTADRDEWRTQHENLLAMYRAAESRAGPREEQEVARLASEMDDALSQRVAKLTIEIVEARERVAKAEAERDEARVALANISGALVDSGLPVPEEKDYHKAVRALTAERDEARAHVEQLVGDIQAVSADYTEASAERRELRDVVAKCRDWFVEEADQSSSGDAWKMRDFCTAALTAPVVAQSAGDSAPSAHGAGSEKKEGV